MQSFVFYFEFLVDYKIKKQQRVNPYYKMSYINVVQSCWNFAQLKEIKNSQNLKSLTLKNKKKLGQQSGFQKVWNILLVNILHDTYYLPFVTWTSVDFLLIPSPNEICWNMLIFPFGFWIWISCVHFAFTENNCRLIGNERKGIKKKKTIYRTRAIISRGFYFFLPNFHFGCGLYCRQFMY